MKEEEMLEGKNGQILKLQKEVERLKKSVKTQKYGLVWMDVPEGFEDDVENKLPILDEVSKLAVENKDGKPTHILIQGDNYHALTCLNYTHKGKIDLIYIDPPYNTGSDGFRYKDKRILEKYPDGTEVPKDHPFRHSYWLSFMRKRLELCVELLNDRGVILVHMDENENLNLGLLLNEVFGEQNCLGQVVWNKLNPKGDAREVSVMHELVFCYAKHKSMFLQQKDAITRKKINALEILSKAKSLYNKLKMVAVPETIKDAVKPFAFSKKVINQFKVKYSLGIVNLEFQNWLKNQPFSGGEKAYRFIDKSGRVFRTVSMAWPNKDKAPAEYFVPLIHPVTKKRCPVPARGWRNPPSTMKRLLEQGLIVFGSNETTQPTRKYFLDENLIENTPSIYEFGGSDDDLLKQLGISFPYAKPVEVAKYFISSIHPNPRVVLDFFAGSGTTGQAVMELNELDNGTRQFILVTNNENNIMTDTCYPRIKRTIEGYKTWRALGGSVKFYETKFVGKNNILQASDKDKIELAHSAGGLLAIAENTLEQVEKTNYFQIFQGNDRYTAVYFREEYDKFESFVTKVINLSKPVSVYVFSWEDDPSILEFEEHGHISIKTIPEPILKIYRQIHNLI